MTTTRAVPAARVLLALLLLAGSARAQGAPPPAAPHFTAVRAGRLIDPATGTVATDQIILMKDKRFEAIGRRSPSPRAPR